jgi:uncharacterized protein YhjY with autotransporter beta-barrel domain
LRRNRLIYGVLMASAAGSALADDLTVTGTTNTTPLFTNNAANGTPGNIVLSTGALVSVSVQDPALTINSNNTVINGGTLQNSFTGNGAVGVRILGGNTGSFIQQSRSLVNVTGSGTGNSAILVEGSAPFTGTIDLQLNSAIFSRGVGGVGLNVRAPLVGDIKVDGAINGFGTGANGIFIAAPVTGQVSIGGQVFVAAYANAVEFSASFIDPITGSALAVGSDVTGGIIVQGPGGIGSVIPQGSLRSTSSLPTFVIASGAGGAPAGNITIGMNSTDLFNPSFSLINRGSITNSENDPGISPLALRIGESSATAPANTVTLTGGFYNRGQVSVQGRSDNLFALREAAAPTNATAMEIGSGARLLDSGSRAGQLQAGSTDSSIVLDAGASSVDDFYTSMTVFWNGQERLITDYNGSTKTATIAAFRNSSATFTGTPGTGDNFQIKSAAFRNDGGILGLVNGTQPSTVTALLIQPNGSVPSLINSGTIKTEAYSTLSTTSNLIAYGIRDQSGTLTQITNTGSILALAGYNPTGLAAQPLDDKSQKTIAIDISAATANQTILTYGSITGDVRFGSGNNLLLVEGATAGVSGAVTASGAGTVDILVSQEGKGGTFLTYETQARNISMGAGSQTVFLLTSDSLSKTAMAASGNITFSNDSVIAVLPGSFLADGEYKLATAGGNIHFDNPAETAAIVVPFLFHATVATDNGTSVASDGKELKMTLARKSAAELGLQNNSAAIYDSVAAAALKDTGFGAALMNLADINGVQNALQSVLPDMAGGVRALTVSFTDQATGVIGSRQRALLTAPQGTREEFYFWAQEFYNNVQQKSVAGSSGFGAAGQGLAFGGEWGSLSTGRYGVGLSYFASQEIERRPRETKTNGDWLVASAYAAWRAGDFFIAPQVNAGFGEMKSRRTVITGPMARLAFANYKAQLAAGGFTSGYILDLGDFEIIPTLALDGLYLRTSDYNERNASGLGLHLNSQTQTSVRGFAGIVGKGSFEYQQGFLMPQILAGYSREFLNEPTTIDGFFEAAPGTPFHLTGPKIDPNRLIGGVSMGYVLRNWSAGVNYDATSTTGLLAQSATVSISSRF